MNAAEQLQEMIKQSHRIVFFGGAGVSTESGIPDFRSADGLYRQSFKYPPETILSNRFFLNHTAEFYDFYKENMVVKNAKPNAAHWKLAEWEQNGKLQAVITQNIDGLHQLAGSKNVLELHGSIHRNHCMLCRKSYTLEELEAQMGVPHCVCGGIIKPDVVLYEEPLDTAVLKAAVQEITQADMLIIGGTSLSVYPAAGIVQYFQGKYLVLINRDKTNRDQSADLIIREPIAQVFGALRA